MLALKLEIQELRREVVELRQQKCSIPDPLPHTVPTYTSQQNVAMGPPAAKSYSNTVRTQHAATPQGTSPSSTQTQPAQQSPMCAACTSDTCSCTVHAADTQCCEAGVTGICSTEPTQNTWKEVNHRRKGRQDKFTDSVSKALRATITSRYVKESPNTEPADPCVLTGVVPINKLVLYVGSINSGCNAHSIRDWCEARDVEVLNCSVMESKYLGTSYARVTVAAEHEERVLDRAFWPEAISHSVRKWRFADSPKVTKPASNA